MVPRMFLVISVTALTIAGCGQAPTGKAASMSPTAPSGLAATSPDRPFKAHLTWTATGVQWAGAPGQAKSLFGGRCSVPSDYVVSASFDGEATHLGRFTGTGSHCSQITWSPEGQPLGATYGDGSGTVMSANGSRFTIAYDHGVTGLDAASGETWFQDDFTLAGVGGPFGNATASGQEGGRFLDFAAILGGAPVPMVMEGTIKY